jgi:glucose-1-phosphate cytidylyltransferase
MKFYASYGFEEFVVALGYKPEVVNFFLQFADIASDLTINLATGTVERAPAPPGALDRSPDRYRARHAHRGACAASRARHQRRDLYAHPWHLSDVPLDRLLAYHRVQGKLVTVTAVSAPARFGGIAFYGDRLVGFAEKHAGSDGWINGG